MLWVCGNCSTRYAESLGACPHCGATERRANHEVDAEEEEDADVPKIVAGVGPSNALGQDPDAPFGPPAGPEPGEQPPASVPVSPEGAEAPPEPPPVKAPKAEHVEYAATALGVPPEEAESLTKPELVELARSAASEGGDDPSAGGSSSTSSKSGAPSSSITPLPLPPTAPTTGSPSSPAPRTPGPSSGATGTAGSTPATTSDPSPADGD